MVTRVDLRKLKCRVVVDMLSNCNSNRAVRYCNRLASSLLGKFAFGLCCTEVPESYRTRQRQVSCPHTLAGQKPTDFVHHNQIFSSLLRMVLVPGSGIDVIVPAGTFNYR